VVATTQILESGDKIRWDKNREEKDSKSSGLTSTKKYERCVEVFEVSKLL